MTSKWLSLHSSASSAASFSWAASVSTSTPRADVSGLSPCTSAAVCASPTARMAYLKSGGPTNWLSTTHAMTVL